ncbi:intracellular growth attenuator family protein [Entomohabitans teleogrylli]|uniref:intracellular growth attenuator family protein n=1 Tax=Entomohabitans teleogrylli TaxID=1384589 RepID=UPI00073D70A4|nr:intracellular growth attenuator family protein [Entomohabitans teleogrylli]
MSAVLIFITVMFVSLVVAGVWYWRYQYGKLSSLPFPGASTRRLTAAERSAAENYLDTVNRSRQIMASAAPAPLSLNAHSNTVICLTRSITRYGLSGDAPNKWRYYLESTEVHLPPFWEQYISSDNDIELIATDSLPLVISLNGHSLQEYLSEAHSAPALENPSSNQASIRREESEQVELLRTRKETREEYQLSRQEGLREAFLMVCAFLLLFLCLITPGFMQPWLLGGGCVVLAASLWGLFGPPLNSALREIHCLRGTPKRWGLFGESNQDQASNISMGIIDLIYPAHWRPFIANDLGQTTEIDIYLDRHVARQGPYLSLHDEVKHFPLQPWIRNLIIATGALVVLIMMVLWVPLDMPLKLTLSWLKGAQTIETTDVRQLEQAGLRVGDTLRVRGKGMCNISMSGSFPARQGSAFAPFDCSQIIWNTARPLPLPESDMVDKASALIDVVSRQLHPQTGDDNKVNPQLASAIQKSGMILMSDFASIVKNTQALCTGEDECVRLKNALVNLGNSKDWDTLTRRANAGKLNGVNLVLRPVSAESLDNLVTTSTAPFFLRETSRAAQALNSPAPGGFVIASDEGNDLVNLPSPPVALNDHPPQEQWQAFRRLAESLLDTPFSAEGIVTSLRTDANGTRHVMLHAIPDSSGMWRNVSTTLLLVSMLVALCYNGFLAIRRYQRHQSRLAQIQQYYENCLNDHLLTHQELP